MIKRICFNCKKEKKAHKRVIDLIDGDRFYCNNCYRKLFWKPKLVRCKRCGRDRPNHALGFCNGCYNSLFHIKKVRRQNLRKSHGLPDELYDEITNRCVICGFSKIVDLHHIDHNHENRSRENLVGLCPNHHQMIHHRELQDEIFDILVKKCFKIKRKYEKDEFYIKRARPSIHKKRFEKHNNP